MIKYIPVTAMRIPSRDNVGDQHIQLGSRSLGTVLGLSTHRWGSRHTCCSNEQILRGDVGDEALVHGHRDILQEESRQEDVHWGACHCEFGSECIVGLRAAYIHCSICHGCEGRQVNGRALRLQHALKVPAARQHVSPCCGADSRVQLSRQCTEMGALLKSWQGTASICSNGYKLVVAVVMTAVMSEFATAD